MTDQHRSVAEEIPAGELVQRLGRNASEALDAVSQRLRKYQQRAGRALWIASVGRRPGGSL